MVNTASSVGMGATLMQLEDINDPKSLRPIAFWSHRLNENEADGPCAIRSAMDLFARFASGGLMSWVLILMSRQTTRA